MPRHLVQHVVLGAQVVWRPVRAIAVHAMVGPRFSDASNPALEPHREPASAVARVGILFDGRVAAEWSYNQYGDGREHISVGYRVAPRGNDDRNR